MSDNDNTTTPRKVSFEPMVKVKLIPHLNDISNKRWKKLWYSQKEITKMIEHDQHQLITAALSSSTTSLTLPNVATTSKFITTTNNDKQSETKRYNKRNSLKSSSNSSCLKDNNNRHNSNRKLFKLNHNFFPLSLLSSTTRSLSLSTIFARSSSQKILNSSRVGGLAQQSRGNCSR